MSVRICASCGKKETLPRGPVYIARHPRCAKCSHKFRRDRIRPIACAACSKPFLPRTQRGGGARTKFCSQQCSGAAHRHPLPLCQHCGKRLSNREATLCRRCWDNQPHTCAICSKSFFGRGRAGQRTSVMTCSHECKVKLRTLNWRDYQREYTKIWRAENEEYLRKQKKAWQIANAERLKAKRRAELPYRRAMYALNREHIRATKLAWYTANKTRVNELKRKSRAKHAETIIHTPPKGEKQWLERNRVELRTLRRLLKNPREALQSPKEASPTPNNSPR